MAPTLTWEVWPVSALWMTPGFSDQLSSCWATCFFPLRQPLFFTASSLCSSLLCLGALSHQNAAEQQTPKSGYKLQTCLWHRSACSPLSELWQQTLLSSLLGAMSNATPTSPWPSCPFESFNGNAVLLLRPTFSTNPVGQLVYGSYFVTRFHSILERRKVHLRWLALTDITQFSKRLCQHSFWLVLRRLAHLLRFLWKWHWVWQHNPSQGAREGDIYYFSLRKREENVS